MNMQFVNNRQSAFNNLHQLQPNNRILSLNRIGNIRQQSLSQPTVAAPSLPKNDPKKIKWGPPTWYLFHTLAEKIKDEYFLSLRAELINNIIAISRNLPCPRCAAHASEYMSKININSIRTKEDLKNILFTFHNDVNGRTGSPQFSYDELSNKYSVAITKNVIHTFFIFFQDKSFNVTAIANNMHRARVIESLKTWFNKNIQYFTP